MRTIDVNDGVASSRPPGQSPGLSHVSKEFIEEFFAPCSELHFAGEGPIVGVSAQNIGRHSPDSGEILRSIVLAGSCVVFVEDDVEGPVQMIFHAPVRAIDFQHALGRKLLGEGDIVRASARACSRPGSARIRRARARRDRERPAHPKAPQSRSRGAAPADRAPSRPARRRGVRHLHRPRRKPSRRRRTAARGWPSASTRSGPLGRGPDGPCAGGDARRRRRRCSLSGSRGFERRQGRRRFVAARRMAAGQRQARLGVPDADHQGRREGAAALVTAPAGSCRRPPRRLLPEEARARRATPSKTGRTPRSFPRDQADGKGD